MTDQRNDGTGAPPSHIHVEGGDTTVAKKTNWLPWILAALALLGLLLLLSQCGGNRDAAVVAPVPVETTETTVTETTVANTVDSGPATGGSATGVPLAGTAGLGAYLAGQEALPRSFVF